MWSCCACVSGPAARTRPPVPGARARGMQRSLTVAFPGVPFGRLQIWDFESGEFERTLKGHTNTVQFIAFDKSGKYLASCAADLSIKLWLVETWQCAKVSVALHALGTHEKSGFRTARSSQRGWLRSIGLLVAAQ